MPAYGTGAVAGMMTMAARTRISIVAAVVDMCCGLVSLSLNSEIEVHFLPQRDVESHLPGLRQGQDQPITRRKISGSV